MLTVLYGADSFSRYEALAALRARLDTDGMLATNTTALEARGLTPAELMMVCDALPFLGAWRLVHVRGLLARAGAERAPSTARRRGSRAAATATAPEVAGGWLALAEYVPRMPPTTVLVLEDAAIRETNTLLAALREARAEPAAVIQGFGALDQRALRSWVVERARRREIALDPAALELLVKSAPVEPGEDGQWHALWALTADLEKLSLYAGGGRISGSDVERLAPAALESRLWLLADQVLAGDRGPALAVLEELLAAGRPVPVLLVMLANRVRQVLVVRELSERRVPDAEMAERSGVRAGYPLQQVKRQAQQHALAALERAYLRIVQADRDIKTGRTDETTALELLVAELTRGR